MRIRTVHVLSSSRLGYRGAFLLFLALIDFAYGAFLIHPAPEQVRTSQFIWRDGILPTEAWGAIWLTVGAAVLISAFMRQDRIGYALAIALKIGWATLAAAGGMHGHTQGTWTAVAIWGGFAALTILESGRAEPVRSHEVTVMDESSE